MEDGSSLHALLAARTGHTYLHVADSPPSFDAVLVPPGGAVADRYGLVDGATVGHPPRRLRGPGGLQGRRAGAGALQGGRAAGLKACARYCGSTSTDSATPCLAEARRRPPRRLPAPRAIWPSRSGPRTTSWARSLPWRRNSGTGPSTLAPGRIQALGAARRRPRARGRARRTSRRSAPGGRRAGTRAPCGGAQLAAQEARRSRAARRTAGRGPRGPAPAPPPARGPSRGRCARPAGPRARTCAPRRGSRGSAACCRRRAPRRGSRRRSRGPWPPSGCPPARPRARPRTAPAWPPRPRRPPSRRPGA